VSKVADPRWLAPLRELCALHAPPGREAPVTGFLLNRWQSRLETVERTRIGNLIARVGGHGPRLLVCAHADEICLMVRGITDDGFLLVSLWFRDSLGHLPQWLYPIGHPALVLGSRGAIDGVFGTVTGHAAAQRGARRTHDASWDDVFVDIGASSVAEARSWGIHPGCHVIWNTPVRRINNLVTGKALDDRIGLAVMDDILPDLDPKRIGWDLYYAATVMEEIGLIGAAEVVDRVRPDLVIIVEVGLAGDIPGADSGSIPVRLGNGPVIVFQDAGTHYSWDFSQRVIALAHHSGIPIQEAVYQSYSSDGRESIRLGVPTVLLTFPCRYTHSPFETAHLADVSALRGLLQALLHADHPEDWITAGRSAGPTTDEGEDEIEVRH
jgi:endoglucanase